MISFAPKTYAQPAPVLLLVEPDQQDVIIPVFQAAADDILARYHDEYGLTLTQPIELIVSQDPEFIASMRSNSISPDYSVEQLQDFHINRCKTRRPMTGIAFTGQVVICLNSSATITPAWLDQNKTKMTRLLAHELMHVFQRELSGSLNEIKEGRRTHGPVWLVEGSAIHAAYLIEGIKKDPRQGCLLLDGLPAKFVSPLRDLMIRSELRSYGDYLVAETATSLLVESFGYAKVLEYWNNLGAGAGWETTFSQTFGVTLDQFMNDFETFRDAQFTCLE